MLSAEQRAEVAAALELAKQSDHRGQGGKIAPQWGEFSDAHWCELIDASDRKDQQG